MRPRSSSLCFSCCVCCPSSPTASDKATCSRDAKSAPRPLSLLYLVTKDERLLKAFGESCEWIMEQMEPDTATRVRAGGAGHDRKTGNWTYAGWLHFDSRPDD